MPAPGSWSDAVSVSLTGSPLIDPLLGGTRWASSSISYSFPDPGSWSTSNSTGYGPSNGDQEPWSASYGALSASDQGFFNAAIQQWASSANLQISFVADTATNVGDIRAAYTYVSSHDGAQAWAYLPADAAFSGDVWFNALGTSADGVWTPGTYLYFTVLHELGHALGLQHPFDGDSTLSSQYDNWSYTVMSYTASSAVGDNYASYYPTTPMYLDLLAMQTLYGQPLSANLGDTTYTFSGTENYWQTISDSGGNDTIVYVSATGGKIDLSNTSFSELGIPIRFSDSSTQAATVGLGPSVVIENATGGSGGDTLIGNSVANLLLGGAGNDTIDGGAGDDQLQGLAGDDSIVGGDGSDNITGNAGTEVLDGQAGNDTVHGGPGNDTVSGGVGDDSVVGGTENDVLSGGAGNDILIGNAGDDQLSGNADNDTLNGGPGEDLVIGGAGDDSMVGGDGNDNIIGNAGVEVLDGQGGNDTVHGGPGNDIVSGGAGDDSVVGGTENDLLAGGEGNDIVIGNIGDDTLAGDAGDDSIFGGPGNDVFRYDATSLNSGDVQFNGSDTIFASSGDVISMLGLNDDLLLDGVPLSALASDTQLGFPSGLNTNISFDVLLSAASLNEDGSITYSGGFPSFGVLQIGGDFEVLLPGINSVTYDAADDLFQLA